MYSKRTGLIIGFHGCDKKVRDKIVSKKGAVLEFSDNNYDWLGSGIYFWENNFKRAFEFATFLSKNPPHNKKQKIKEPAVLGAIIDLCFCFDLLDSEYLNLLKVGYGILKKSNGEYGKKNPKNLPLKEMMIY